MSGPLHTAPPDKLKSFKSYLSAHMAGSFIWNLLLGVEAALLISLYHWFWNSFRYDMPELYVAGGMAVSFACWIAERIWITVVGPMHRDPFSAPAYLTRIPFWWLAGGIGYVAGITVAKIALPINFYEVPIKIYFFIGAFAGIFTRLTMQIRVYGILKHIEGTE